MIETQTNFIFTSDDLSPTKMTEGELKLFLENLVLTNKELLETLEKGQLKSWVHNAALTNDIEALRKICLEWADWWNNAAIAVIEKASGNTL